MPAGAPAASRKSMARRPSTTERASDHGPLWPFSLGPDRAKAVVRNEIAQGHRPLLLDRRTAHEDRRVIEIDARDTVGGHARHFADAR